MYPWFMAYLHNENLIVLNLLSKFDELFINLEKKYKTHFRFTVSLVGWNSFKEAIDKYEAE